MPANSILAEALARIEHKLDLLLKQQGAFWDPVNAPSLLCPVCRRQVQYQMNLFDQMVTRVCGCGTGMQPPLVSFLPLPQGAQPDGRLELQQSPDGTPGTQNGPGR